MSNETSARVEGESGIEEVRGDTDESKEEANQSATSTAGESGDEEPGRGAVTQAASPERTEDSSKEVIPECHCDQCEELRASGVEGAEFVKALTEWEHAEYPTSSIGPALLEETGHPSRLDETPEEVLVTNFVNALRERWEKMQPGVDTVYTFEGYLGQQLLFAREIIQHNRKPEPKVGESGLSDEQVMKQKYPNASVWRHGSWRDGFAIWKIYDTKHVHDKSQVLGIGESEEWAWADARGRIEAKPELLPNTLQEERVPRDIAHTLWYRGSRLHSELKDSLTLHPEIWHADGLHQMLGQWSEIATRYASEIILAAPKVVDSKEEQNERPNLSPL